MQFTQSLRYLLNAIQNLTPKDVKTTSMIQQILLRLNQLLSELARSYSNLQEKTIISEKIGKIITFLLNNKIASAKNEIKDLYEITFDEEQQEFETFYPNVKKIYAKLIKNNYILTEKDWEILEISRNDRTIILRLLRRFLTEGEPLFADEIPPADIIRGKNLVQLKPELIQRFLIRSKSDLEVIYASALILEGGYTFREARIISQYLEQEKLFVIRESEQFPEFNQILNQTGDSTTKFLWIDWTAGWPESIQKEFPICSLCNLPYPIQNKIKNSDYELNFCGLCKKREDKMKKDSIS